MKLKKKLLIFETHPIQYRAPVYQEIERLYPGKIEVVYASDFSVRGYKDADFGAEFSWDVPLLAGYQYRVLGNEENSGIKHWRGLSGKGVDSLIGDIMPNAILLHSFGYKFNWVAYWAALRRGIPVWIRMETQDNAVERGRIKAIVRSLVYRFIYLGVSKAFYIGELNRKHLLKHGMKEERLKPALYCTPDPIKLLQPHEKEAARTALRAELNIPADHWVVAFFGKLIPKKDPEIIQRALQELPATFGRNVTCLFVGSGELEHSLREQSRVLEAERGIKTIFSGFVNQSKLPAYYLASDVVVLPSRRSGETWGLVVNEALQAGCAVVVSQAVGCHCNFGQWERVRTISVGDCRGLSSAFTELEKLPRDFCWAEGHMSDYSTNAAAIHIHQVLEDSEISVETP